ncbi:unnamed protein product [Vitrella brassicaformis CCMP3155]|uniref:Transporter n=1 Tax=Vitrella brassicaformis (strain CCMP3155) TaxID=1169540 RepID=A0A0G4EE36_VITBC|nr:unnamed protein product [Vitrella brassicaformis CCMP3155]|eukprot:CEL93623.1 unnamed protein product [Vitrella brassicaformis CCMP3155]
MGAAIGLGNLWRFPYLSYSYGGGAFFIPYLGALFLIGIPLLTTELALGQVYEGGHAVAFGMLSKRFLGLGYGSAWACFIVAAYYNVLLAYACLYFVASFQNPLPWAATAKTAQLCKTAGASAASCAALGTECMWADGECSQALIGKANAYLYETVLEQSEVSGGIGWLVPHIAVAALVVWLICYLSMFKGASQLGRVASAFVVLPFVLLAALIITGLSLPGMEMGVHQYIGRWDLSILSSRPQIWSDAVSQIFFSVGSVWGMMTAYASYNKKGQNVAQDALIVSLSNSACSILAGLAAFSICGHLAYEAGIPLKELPTESMGLAFVSYPIGLAQIPGWGARLFNVFFFAVLICLGVASAFSFVECPATVLLDTSWFGRVPRWLMVGILSVVGYGLSLVYSTDIGYHLIDASDWYVANVLALSLGFLESVAVGWAARIDVQEGHIGKKGMCGSR